MSGKIFASVRISDSMFGHEQLEFHISRDAQECIEYDSFSVGLTLDDEGKVFATDVIDILKQLKTFRMELVDVD
jgi:hypothetical protein